MNFTLFGLMVSIERGPVARRRALARRVDNHAVVAFGKPTKINRIKAWIEITYPLQGYGGHMVEGKNWVEEAYTAGGLGEVA